MATAILLKHYRDLVRNITSFSNGQAYLKVEDADDEGSDTIETIRITIAPREGPYHGGKFDFELDLSEGYPNSAPVVRCFTQVYHPNIDWYDSQGDVCLNLLDELWSSEMTLEDVVQGLLFLFYNPNIEDPLSSMFTGGEDEEEFLENVRRSLRGEEIDGVAFERNLSEEYNSEGKEDVCLGTVKKNTIETVVEELVTADISMPTSASQTILLSVSERGVESSVDRVNLHVVTYSQTQASIFTAAVFKAWTCIWQYAQTFRMMAMVIRFWYHHALDFRQGRSV